MIMLCLSGVICICPAMLGEFLTWDILGLDGLFKFDLYFIHKEEKLWSR